MKIKTYLLSGAGNTFHIGYSDSWAAPAPSWTPARMKVIAKSVCEAKPADGFIFLEKNKIENIEPKTNEQYGWYFFNNDGSAAEMCGNATRCVGFYIKNILKSTSNEWSLLTVAGPIKIEFVADKKFKITMTPIKELKSEKGFYCDTGVPHLVIEKSRLETDRAAVEEASKLRFDSEFYPRGTNVTFVELGKEITKLKAVSYERGVEDYTAACGTGAAAAAFYNLTKRAVKQTEVEMPGGTLIMDLSDLNKPTMIGSAELLGEGEYEISV